MITDSLEFPCVEAARCHLTEKEYGLRLTITKKPAPLSKNKEHDQQAASSCSFQLELTERRDRNTEWYVHFDVSTTKGGLALRSVSFRHVGTGRYLCFSSQDDDARRIGTQSFSNEDTIWLMEHPQSSSSPQSPQNHYSSPQHHRSPHSRSPPSPELRRTYSDGLDLRRSNSIGWESSGSPPRGVVESEPWTVQYHLLPKGLDSHKVSCHRSDDCKSGLELTTTEFGRAATWELEFTSGELCFIRNPALNSQIRCNAFGKLALSPYFQGWEVFRFIEVGHGHVAISSWTHCQKYLSSDPDGRVYTSENRLGHWEKWRLEKTSPHGLHIISVAHPDRYLCIGRGEDLALQTTTRPNDFSLWHLDGAHANTFYLSSNGSNNKQQVSSHRKGPFLSPHRRDWEEWKLERTPRGDLYFFSKAHQKYLGCNSRGDLHTTSSKGDWSIWEIEESQYGGVCLKSKPHHMYLSVEKGRLCSREEPVSEAESFRLEPSLPATISGPRLAALGVAGAVGLALTFAMPFAVLAVMEVAATEILIGAGGGALIGAGVLGTTAAVVKDEVNDRHLSRTAEVKDDYLIGLQRPISAWRNW